MDVSHYETGYGPAETRWEQKWRPLNDSGLRTIDKLGVGTLPLAVSERIEDESWTLRKWEQAERRQK